MIISEAKPVKMPISFGDATGGGCKLGIEFHAYAYCLYHFVSFQSCSLARST